MVHALRSSRTPLSVVLIGFLSGSVALAQNAACDWTRVRVLHPGQSIAVRTADGRQTAGRLVTSTDTEVTVAVGGVPEKLSRDRVAEISAPRTAASKTGIGLVLAGLSLMVAGVANRPPEAGPGPAWFAGAPMALVGALVVRSERKNVGLIYRRP